MLAERVQSDPRGLSERPVRVHIEALLTNLAANDPKIVRSAALALGELKDRSAVPRLIDILRESWNPGVWNAAAVALRDLGDPRAVPTLVERIRDPKTESSRGTL